MSMELVCVGCPAGCGTEGVPFEAFSLQDESDDPTPPERTVIYKFTGDEGVEQRFCYEIGSLIQYFAVERGENNQPVPRHPSNRQPFLDSDVRRIIRYWRDVLREPVPVELSAAPQPGAFDAVNQAAIQAALGEEAEDEGDIDISATEHPSDMEDTHSPLAPAELAVMALRILPYTPLVLFEEEDGGAVQRQLILSHASVDGGAAVYHIFTRGEQDLITISMSGQQAQTITPDQAEAFIRSLPQITYVEVPPVLLSIPPPLSPLSPSPIQRRVRGREEGGDEGSTEEPERPPTRRRLF